jgi:hypothetical protein
MNPEPARSMRGFLLVGALSLWLACSPFDVPYPLPCPGNYSTINLARCMVVVFEMRSMTVICRA